MNPEFKPDYIIETNIASDAMKANVRIIPSLEKEEDSISISIDDIYKNLHKAGIVYGVKTGTIAQIVEKKIFNQWMCIAEGKPPVQGKDGSVTLTFLENNEDQPPREHISGKVNFRELGLIRNVQKDDVLARIQPPTHGELGMTVHGKEVSAKNGKAAPVPKGQNTSLTEDGLLLLADLSGLVALENKKVHVHPVYEVDVVDASVGNIHFNGSVVVNGEVGDGYEIHAGGDIHIAMTVGVAILEAKGAVHIEGGILGSQKGKINAGTNIYIKFIQDATVTAGGSIIVDDYIRGSEVSAVGPIIVKSPEGSIAGSTISSESWIYANSVGTKHSTQTNLIVGYDPSLPRKKESMIDDIHNLIKDSLKLYASLVKLRHIKQKNGLNQQQSDLYIKIISALTTIQDNLESLDKQILEIDEKISRVYGGFIYIPGSINEGGCIQIGQASKHVVTTKACTQFCLMDGELMEAAFNMKPEIKSILESDPHD